MRVCTLRHHAGSFDAALPDFDGSASLAFVFGSTDYLGRAEPFDELARAMPGLTLVGCSSAGEILRDQIGDGTLSIGIISFESTTVRTAAVPIAHIDDSREVGAKLARELAADGIAGVTVFSDGLVVNGSELAEGLHSELPRGTVVSGGLAADGDRFETTWTLVDGHPETGYVTAVAYYGDRVGLACGSDGGWGPFGPVRTITRSQGSVLYELDGRPALELYKEYLGERAAGLPATALLFPLQIEGSHGRPVVRTVLSVDEEAQSLTFAGDVPEGQTGQLMVASFDALIDGATSAAESGAVPNSGPVLRLAISCVGRRLVLGDECEDEVEATLFGLPDGSGQVGFYSYGELAPTGAHACDLHNQTMTVTTIHERVVSG